MERNAKIDNVKFFLICCVVLGHIGNTFAPVNHLVACSQLWVYLFHMPAFVFLSGLFSKRTVNEKRWDKILPYIILFVFMKSVIFFGTSITDYPNNSLIQFSVDGGAPWYALAMFWWGAATIIMKDVKPSYVLSVSVFLAAMAGYATDLGSFLSVLRTLVFYPFYYRGYITDTASLIKAVDTVKAKIVSWVVIIVSILRCFLLYDKLIVWRNLFRGSFHFSALNVGISYSWGWLWRIAGYIISFVLTLSVISIAPGFKSVFSRIGQRTLSVFVFHAILQHFTSPWVTLFINTGKTGRAVCIIWMLCIVFFTSLPPFEWTVRQIMNVPMKNKE